MSDTSCFQILNSSVGNGGNPPAERFVYENSFSGSLGPEWEIYDSIGNAGWGLRRPSAVSIAPDPTATDGEALKITADMGVGAEAGQLVSGGIKLKNHAQTYGVYTARIRVDDDPAQALSGVALLWPLSNLWPQDGEIDWFETWGNRDTRTPVEGNIHWLNPAAVPPYTPADDLFQQITHPGIDGSDWHVYQLVWEANLVTVSVDGGTPVVLASDPAKIPDWPMEVTFQLDAFDSPLNPNQQPVVTQPVDMCVDWVLVETL